MSSAWHECAPAPVLLLDGAYSGGPELSDLVNFAVLMDVLRAVRHERLRGREQEDFLREWHARWDSAEEHYFADLAPPSRFDLVVSTDGMAGNPSHGDGCRGDPSRPQLAKVTAQEPRMWGPTIVGFGSYHDSSASGNDVDSAFAAFAARGRELVVYLAEECDGRDDLLARLCAHSIGKVCVYIRRLANVDLTVLEQRVARSVADTKHRYPENSANHH